MKEAACPITDGTGSTGLTRCNEAIDGITALVNGYTYNTDTAKRAAVTLLVLNKEVYSA